MDEQLRDVPPEDRRYAKHSYPKAMSARVAQSEFQAAHRKPEFDYDMQ